MNRLKDDVQKIFELWCEVSTEEVSGSDLAESANNNNNNGDKIHPVVQRFPVKFSDSRVLADIPHFAFPCEFENKTVQTYSFVLTCTDSKFRFGFCRHEPNSRTAYVLITYLPWHDIFLKFLNILVELRKRDSDEFQQVLQFVYDAPIPRQGTLKVNYDRGASVFVFQPPPQFQLPSIPENHNLNMYYNFVEPKNMIAIFAAMLNERRVIFTSRRLDILSSCIQAANHFLTPLCWQHIFIPVLPMKLKDFLLAPMPFLIGVPEQVLRTVRREEIGDVVILHCDTKTVETPFDDVKEFPAELVSQLKKQLSNPAEHRGDRVSRIFLRVLVQLIGGYRDAMCFRDKKITWDADTFVESRPSSLRPFLRKMMDLQIFHQFIEERLEMLNGGLGFSDEFEVETLRDDPSKRGKNYKEFLNKVKDKTNPAMKSAVKSVKEGGKGMKTAYKDLKSKLKHNNQSSSSSRSEFHGVEENNNHTSFVKPSRDHQRRSAPSSPVFNKGPRSSSATSPYSPGTQSLMQPSSSASSSSTLPMGNGGNYAYAATASSPTGAAAPLSGSNSSSSSMSEINLQLWQELQHHDLFKSPPVDRTLKSNSAAVVNDAALRPPTTMAPPVPVKKKISIPSVFLVDDAMKMGNGVRPMDRPPPPRPMRPSFGALMQNSDGGAGATGQAQCNASNSLSSTMSRSSSPQKAPSSLVQGNNHSSLLSLSRSPANELQKGQHSHPQPPPRRYQMGAPLVVAEGDSADLHSKCVSVKDDVDFGQSRRDEMDLIKLDTSIELEDFDPLNQNAKPIPDLLPMVTPQRANGNGSAIPVGGFNNPLYPYFEPPFMGAGRGDSGGDGAAAVSPAFLDDDSELLRKYGLDQFTLEQPASGTSTLKKTQAPATEATTRTNWTTFE